MKDIFITGTFRNEWNKNFNEKLEKKLTEKGFSCFLPQRDSEQKGNKINTFSQDIEGIDNSRMIVAVGVKTQTANWGFEIAYAYKSKKPVIILSTKEMGVELLPEQAASHVFLLENIDDIDSYIDELAEIINKLKIDG